MGSTGFILSLFVCMFLYTVQADCPIKPDLSNSATWLPIPEPEDPDPPENQFLLLFTIPERRNPTGRVTITLPSYMEVTKVAGGKQLSLSGDKTGDHTVEMEVASWAQVVQVFGTATKKVRFDARDMIITTVCPDIPLVELPLSQACDEDHMDVSVELTQMNDHFYDTVITFGEWIVGSRMKLLMPPAISSGQPRITTVHRVDEEAHRDKKNNNVPYEIVAWKREFDHSNIMAPIEYGLADCGKPKCTASDDADLGVLHVEYMKSSDDPYDWNWEVIFTLKEDEDANSRTDDTIIEVKLTTDIRGEKPHGIPQIVWCHLPNEPPAPPPSPIPPGPSSPPTPPSPPPPSPTPNPPPPLHPPHPSKPPPPPIKPALLVGADGLIIKGSVGKPPAATPFWPPEIEIDGRFNQEDVVSMPVSVSILTIIGLLAATGGAWMVVACSKMKCDKRTPKTVAPKKQEEARERCLASALEKSQRENELLRGQLQCVAANYDEEGEEVEDGLELSTRSGRNVSAGGYQTMRGTSSSRRSEKPVFETE